MHPHFVPYVAMSTTELHLFPTKTFFHGMKQTLNMRMIIGVMYCIGFFHHILQLPFKWCRHYTCLVSLFLLGYFPVPTAPIHGRRRAWSRFDNVVTQRRYETITCSNKNAVSSLLSPYTLHSELRWWFSRVIPRDPQAKAIWLWSTIETITLELEIP